MGTPLTGYVLDLVLYTWSMVEAFPRLRSGKQIPAASLVNCTSHHMIALDTLTSLAKPYAIELESGNNPENPPRAMTRGRSPVKKYRGVEFVNMVVKKENCYTKP